MIAKKTKKKHTKSKKRKKKGKKRGRKTVVTKAVVGKLKEGAALDATVSEMCLLAGISRDTYYAYVKKDKKFTDRIEQLRSYPFLKARTAIISALSTNPELALKYLERKLTKEFAPLVRQAPTDNEGNNLSPVFDKTESKL